MSSTTGHPKGLYLIFVTGMWERFSYYGMRAIFALYMIKGLLFDKTHSSEVYGSYTGLVYLTPLIGGYMADKYWGNRKSVIVGGILMAIGQFMMFWSGLNYQHVEMAAPIMYFGLAFLIFGNGFFKPNITTMVGQLYPAGDKRLDSAFTIFYMGVNLGAFLAPAICGFLGDTGNPADFAWGFFAAGVGMLLSVLVFYWLKNHYIVSPDGQPVGTIPKKKIETVDIDTTKELTQEFSKQQVMMWAGIGIALFVLFYFVIDLGLIGSFIFALTIAAPGFIISDKTLTKIERERIWVIYIISFFVIFFWAAFEQAGASLTYFAEEQTERNVNWHFPFSVLISLLVIFILLFGYLIMQVIKKMKYEQKGLREVILLLLFGSVAVCLYALIKIPSEGLDYKTMPASFFQTINAVAIVIFAPVFVWIWGGLGKRNMEPASPYKQSIGLLMLALGYLVIAFGVHGIAPGLKVSMMWLVSLYTIHTFGELCLSPIGLSMVNKLAPIKFASLLMGIWFLSTAAANKFAGVLSGLYPEPGKVKHFAGFVIDDLYSFFMIFVVMAGIASVILFFLSKKLLTMMHGVR